VVTRHGEQSRSGASLTDRVPEEPLRPQLAPAWIVLDFLEYMRYELSSQISLRQLLL
jgi:hypothetical protein